MIQEDIVALLTPVFGTNLFPEIAPTGQPLPYAVYGRVTDVPQRTLDDSPGYSKARFQLDVYGTDYMSSQLLAQSAQTALESMSSPQSALKILEVDHYDATLKRYRVIQDYSIWYNP